MPHESEVNLEALQNEKDSTNGERGDSGTVMNAVVQLPKLKLSIIIASLMLSTFLSVMDQNIVATALPVIANQFKALDKITWVASAYLIMQAGLTLSAGQLLTVFPSKHVFLPSVAIFLLGSLVCAVAHTFGTLVAGRAVAGCGGAGMTATVLCIISEVVKLESRPFVYAILGVVYAVASVVGPLLGGAFTTSRLTWRWCFWINLPIGATAIAIILLALPALPPRRIADYNESKTARYRQVDYIGGFLCLGATACLLIPVQLGGNIKPWNSPTVIALFCISGLLLCALLAWSRWYGPSAVVPLRIFRSRTQSGASIIAFFIGMSLLSGTYYLPLWYEAQGKTAVQAGLRILPFFISVVISSVVSGGIIKAVGKYWHVLVISPFASAVGAGLLFTLTSSTPFGRQLGFQILYGVGIGGTLQNIFMAIQTEWDGQPELLAQASAVGPFLTTLGGVTGVAISGAIFNNQLKSNLAGLGEEISSEEIVALLQSVAAIFTLSPSLQQAVIPQYVKSVDTTFLIGVPASVIASVAAFFMENKSIVE